ncbi:hypothetical protein FDECE_4461 [Fusarium decemcellulare]|nr:hypothetical protein FDECE_4461 [Fusarium decemcellulare]
MSNPLRTTPQTTRIAGHRGHSAEAPENTLAAFRKAHEIAGSGVTCETDLALTSDGELVLIHDETVDRTTDGHGLVRDMTYSEISKLDAGQWFDEKFAGERVPLLRDALDLARELGIIYQLELKIYDRNNEIFPKLRALIDELKCADLLQFSSFDFVQLRAVKEAIPDVPTVALSHSRLIDPAAIARQASVDAVNLEIQHFPSGEAHQLHEGGFAVFLHIPRPERLESLKGYGVDIEAQAVGWVLEGLLDQVISDDVAQVAWPNVNRDHPLCAKTLSIGIMDSTSPEEGGRISSPQRHPVNPNYKGRVRTGCLVCRARKVKCDEQRPICQKCSRLKKTCVYKTPSWQRPLPTPMISNLGQTGPQDDQAVQTGSQNESSPPENGDHLIYNQPFTIETPSVSGVSNALRMPDVPAQTDQHLPAPIGVDSPSSNHHIVDSFCQGDDQNGQEPSSTRFQQTSQEILLATTLDWLAAFEEPTQSSFSYFIEEVDSPFISPFDHLNWRRVKMHIARLGTQETSVATSILAVQVLYRAQAGRLPMTHAMSVHQAAISIFESISGSDTVNFDIVLVVAFLLCLSVATLPNEDGPPFSVLDGVFVTRLETWLLGGHRSPVSLRMGAWLQLLHTAIKRVGNPGLLPKQASSLLNYHIKDIPSLSALDNGAHPASALYDIISAPIFAFYLEVQKISNQVADVTHYRRSRITPADQAEVTDILTSLKASMSSTWESRPAPLRLEPAELRQHFRPTIADPLINLAGLCFATYFTEVVAMGRILGHPSFASPEAKHAMGRIRDIVDGDWNASNGGALNPGYLRPLFLYAIENFEKEETQWAADHLRRIENPISRSDFIASFIESHGEAQRSQGRRVTMKAFCYQRFGVPLPYF